MDDRRVLVGEPELVVTVQAVKHIGAVFCLFHAIVNRLSAASGASSRTGHDFDKVILHRSVFQSVQKFRRVSESTDNCNVQIRQ